jgi:hypothetical protein
MDHLLGLFPQTAQLVVPTEFVAALGAPDLVPAQSWPEYCDGDPADPLSVLLTLQDRNVTGNLPAEAIGPAAAKRVAFAVGRDVMGNIRIDGAGDAPAVMESYFFKPLQEGFEGESVVPMAAEIRDRCKQKPEYDGDDSKLLHGKNAIARSRATVTLTRTNFVGMKIPMDRLYPTSPGNVQELSARTAHFVNELGKKHFPVQVGANIVSSLLAHLHKIWCRRGGGQLKMELDGEGRVRDDWLYAGGDCAWSSPEDVVLAWKESDDFVASDYHLTWSSFFNPVSGQVVNVFHIIHPNRASWTGWGKKWIEVHNNNKNSDLNNVTTMFTLTHCTGCDCRPSTCLLPCASSHSSTSVRRSRRGASVLWRGAS